MSTDPTVRRRELATVEIKHNEHDLLVFHTLNFSDAAYQAFVCFVPDRESLVPESLEPYLKSFPILENSLEQCARIVLEDMLNVLIPRYIQVELIHRTATQLQRVLVEEKQAKWDNAGLLSHIPGLKTKT